ncbi:hypothetical protein TNCV_248261 [Trichonephila clavipes]|nr:hypothetical protein TNCV_248261 [Trichonephila clavipes]
MVSAVQDGITHVEQRTLYIKYTVLLRENVMECHGELLEATLNNTLPYRHVVSDYTLLYLSLADGGTLLPYSHRYILTWWLIPHIPSYLVLPFHLPGVLPLLILWLLASL